MILETAIITIKAGMEREFEEGVAKAAPLFRSARARSLVLHRSIETPAIYKLMVGWDTVEDHVVRFRNSAEFAEWRRLVAHCFESPPQVEHSREVVSGF